MFNSASVVLHGIKEVRIGIFDIHRHEGSLMTLQLNSSANSEKVKCHYTCCY